MCVEKEKARELFLIPVGTACSRLNSRIQRQTCRPYGTQAKSCLFCLFYTHTAPTELKTGISVILQKVFDLLNLADRPDPSWKTERKYSTDIE